MIVAKRLGWLSTPCNGFYNLTLDEWKRLNFQLHVMDSPVLKALEIAGADTTFNSM